MFVKSDDVDTYQSVMPAHLVGCIVMRCIDGVIFVAFKMSISRCYLVGDSDISRGRPL